jgi:two-component system NtrC family response regulator
MKILVIDDEEAILTLLSQLIRLEGFNVLTAVNGKTALQLLQNDKEINIVISDVRLPDINGIELITKFKSLNPSGEIIMLTAYGTIEDGVKAIKAGAFDYITKGDEDNKIIPILNKAADKISRLKKLSDTALTDNWISQVTGSSDAIKKSVDLAKKVSKTDSNVLLLGETGVGKEIFAKAIHLNSDRKNKNFVAVNCSAISKDLIESELFGYKAGAFTGALKNKLGLFEEADGGTLFLDEIGELDFSIQSKLLRVLENNSFIKAGDTKETHVNVRIISATNKNLQQSIIDGSFRADLFYRISVISITIPPLRERKEDIIPLTEYFIKLYAAKFNKNINLVSENFYSALTNYSFPGNVRELKNIIERTILLADGNTIDKTNLPEDLFVNIASSISKNISLEETEKEHIAAIYLSTDKNKVKTAELLGIGLTTLYRKLQHYGIE